MEQLDAEINNDLESFRTIALMHRDMDEELNLTRGTNRDETTLASSEKNNETQQLLSSRGGYAISTASDRMQPPDSRECTSHKSFSSTGTHAMERMEKEIIRLRDELDTVRAQENVVLCGLKEDNSMTAIKVPPRDNRSPLSVVKIGSQLRRGDFLAETVVTSSEEFSLKGPS